MEAESSLQLLARARESVVRVRQTLQHPGPQALEEAQPLLAQAIGNLTLLVENGAAGAAAALSPAAAELQREVRQLRVLLDACAGFHLGWTRLLYGMACGYTPHGLAIPSPAAPRILVEG